MQAALGRRRDCERPGSLDGRPDPAGRELLRTFQPAEGSAKTFCATCGANLFGASWPESEHASVRVPALEGFDPRPGSHIFVRSVAPWETLPDDGLERFEIRATDHV